MNSQLPPTISENPLTESLLQLCQEIREFLEEQARRAKSGLPLAESLERTPGGKLCVRKQLPVGLILLATPAIEDPTTAILQISLNPPRFRAWLKSMGSLSMVYMNPYDIEIILERKTGRWGLFLDREELYMDIEGNEIYEVARLEIQEGLVRRVK